MRIEAPDSVATVRPKEETPLPQPDKKPAYDKELEMEFMEELNTGVFVEKPDVVARNLMDKVQKRDQIRDPIIVKAAVDKANEFNQYEVEKKEDLLQEENK